MTELHERQSDPFYLGSNPGRHGCLGSALYYPASVDLSLACVYVRVCTGWREAHFLSTLIVMLSLYSIPTSN